MQDGLKLCGLRLPAFARYLNTFPGPFACGAERNQSHEGFLSDSAIDVTRVVLRQTPPKSRRFRLPWRGYTRGSDVNLLRQVCLEGGITLSSAETLLGYWGDGSSPLGLDGV